MYLSQHSINSSEIICFSNLNLFLPIYKNMNMPTKEINMHRQSLRFIGYSCGYGAENQGTQDGPDHIFESPEFKSLRHSFGYRPPRIVAETSKRRQPVPNVKNFYNVLDNMTSLRDITAQTILKNEFPIIIGGDHTQGLGTAAGVKSALGDASTLGLIWLDAHLDAHTPETTPSKNAHGMPLASIMGQGPEEFVTLGSYVPIVSPENIICIGTRSFEAPEAALMNQLGVHIYHQSDIESRGFYDIFHEAVKYLLQRTTHFGMSLDLDVFDPKHAPGVGTPEKNGLNPRDVIPELIQACSLKKAAWLDISEFNPNNDQDNKTAHIILDMLYKMSEKNGTDYEAQQRA